MANVNIWEKHSVNDHDENNSGLSEWGPDVDINILPSRQQPGPVV